MLITLIFLFQFFDFCPNWVTEVDENDETLKEKNLFLGSSHILTLVLKVNLKLGFFPFGKIYYF